MIYYLYETKNNVNGKIYVGVHKTQNMDDGYLGSGSVLKAAIRKYGIDSFTKTILQTFDSSESMFAAEKELITEDFLKRQDVYNLRIGGFGGFDYINYSGIIKHGQPHTEASRLKISESRKGFRLSSETKDKIKSNNWSVRDPEKQREHAKRAAYSRIAKHGSAVTKETAEKISKTMIGKKQEIVTCPHCGKSGGVRAIKRYHFDKCTRN